MIDSVSRAFLMLPDRNRIVNRFRLTVDHSFLRVPSLMFTRYLGCAEATLIVTLAWTRKSVNALQWLRRRTTHISQSAIIRPGELLAPTP